MKTQPAAGFGFWSAATIALGAFLLFQVQPLISKAILPWFGGSPAVWTTCLLFFQSLLLAGYAYANAVSRVRPSRQAGLHFVLVAVAMVGLFLLPVAPGEAWKPADSSHPVARILLLLTACVGLPYFLLAGTSPLVQSWFAHVYPGRSPYRLYALSNAGSLVALLSYPFVVEPALTIARQGRLWSALFLGYGLLCGWLALQLKQHPPDAKRASRGTAEPTEAAAPPGWRTYGGWLLLPALASVLLMAVTNHLCQNVAVVPFLWIAPLTAYLLSFILCFDRDRWYVRRYFGLGAMLVILVASYLALSGYLAWFWNDLGYGAQWWQFTHNVVLQISVYVTLLFLLCVVCHGEVVRLKPPARRLTAFYLTIAAGGALGGLLVGLVCPLVFSSYLERNLALLVAFVLAAVIFLVDGIQAWLAKASWLSRGTLIATTVVLFGVVAWGQWESWDRERGVLRVRDFYGVMSVYERFPLDPQWHGLALYHGGTLHGFELVENEQQGRPTTYYTERSGAGRALRAMGQSGPLHVGIVGMGVGTLAAYGRQGDRFRFYEIDPQVVALARSHFTFLPRCRAETDVILGDARLSLEREPPQQFDVLVLDAFSGDTIPVHLLTAEAFEVYLRHLKPHGVIAVHISSRYVDLVPVIKAASHHFRFTHTLIRDETEDGFTVVPSDWFLLTHNPAILQQPGIYEVGQVVVEGRRLKLWTDQRNNLFEIVR